jgi:hypothetical protein
MAAKTCADFHFPTLKATAQIKDRDMAAILDKARERAAPVLKVVRLEPQKALPPVQHDPAELKPGAASAANGGFKRRI